MCRWAARTNRVLLCAGQRPSIHDHSWPVLPMLVRRQLALLKSSLVPRSSLARLRRSCTLSRLDRDEGLIANRQKNPRV
jgi:hypothetical protein